LAGDLNSPPEDEAYQILNEEGSLLRDSRGLAQWRYGDKHTFTGFEELKEELTLLDFVFVGKNGWDIKGSSVLSNRFEDGVYSSDHRAVVVDAVLVG
jgi:endonuclease/exonuclease/phosphatase family metal-dependent hydrolase